MVSGFGHAMPTAGSGLLSDAAVAGVTSKVVVENYFGLVLTID